MLHELYLWDLFHDKTVLQKDNQSPVWQLETTFKFLFKDFTGIKIQNSTLVIFSANVFF